MAQGPDGTVTLRDELGGEEYAVRPRLLINATGPWIDRTNQSLGVKSHFIGGTKGSHLVLDHPELREAIGDHEFFFENKDGRIVLIFPLYDRVLVGTSDIATDAPDEAVCTEDEVAYFLEMIGRVFPAIQVGHQHIVFRFSGVRPLAASKSKATGQITRDHEIQVLPAGGAAVPYPVYSLVGGKWTSFRAFSEQVTDKALAFLGMPRRSETRDLPIGGGRDYPSGPADRVRAIEAVAATSGVSLERAEVLFGRYGTRAVSVADFLGAGEDEPLGSLPDYSRREIGFLGLHEKVLHLDDLLLRRSMLAMLGRLSRAAVDEIADALAEHLEWDGETKGSELSRLIRILRECHGVTL